MCQTLIKQKWTDISNLAAAPPSLGLWGRPDVDFARGNLVHLGRSGGKEATKEIRR